MSSRGGAHPSGSRGRTGPRPAPEPGHARPAGGGSSSDSPARLLREGANCWRIAPAERIAFLVDAAAYYRALIDSIAAARESVLILGWDVHSRVLLDPPDRSTELGRVLKRAVRRNRDLRVRLLCWDFSVLFAVEREPLPNLHFGRMHPRIRFELDGNHPTGASHHQKLVVIDDATAFLGGIDLTDHRWDTSEHALHDARRRNAAGTPYDPYHDVQVAVSGPIAGLAGELARGRWRDATGEDLPAVQVSTPSWPSHVRPDLEDVPAGLVRTLPEMPGRSEVRETEQLILDGIAAASRSIYIETQYFTSDRISEALARRLWEEDGPEVLLVVPSHASGWLAESTMDVLRARLIERLRRADRRGRFLAVHPRVGGDDGADVYVHSKLLAVDDRLLTVGSSNLCNRSMGLDSECGLVLESDAPRVERAIARFRDGLLAEHLGVPADQVEERRRHAGSLRALVEGGMGQPRSLEPLVIDTPAWVEEVLPEPGVIDPERPARPAALLRELVPEEGKTWWERVPWLAILALVGAPLLLALLWRFTPLGDWVRPQAMLEQIEPYRNRWSTGPIVVGGYVIGGLLMVPVTALILATALAFGPVLGLTYSTVGALTSAVIGYALGRLIGRRMMRRWFGSRLNRITRRLRSHGILLVAGIRLVPIAPFTVVNLVAGAAHLRASSFVVGTLLGLAPGILALTLFGDRLGAMLRTPDAVTIASLVGVVALLVAGHAILQARLKGARGGQEDG